jgi:hypothetical protein
MIARLRSLPALRSSGRLQSPPLHYGDAPQSATEEELDALMPSILDKAFSGRL